MVSRLSATALLATVMLACAVTPGASGAASRLSFVAVTQGTDHWCAVSAAGGVYCWGSNTRGQLGDGTHRFRQVPVAVKGLRSRVTAVAGGGGHTCGLTVAGGVVCWGNNVSGQLGNGTTTSSNRPVAVVGLGTRVTAIAAGDFHTCALTTAGGVKCWGLNHAGELGDGSLDNRSRPINVVGLSSGVTAISATLGGDRNAGTVELDYSCALTTAGGAKCWGKRPQDYPGLTSGVTAFSARQGSICAVFSGGAVKCNNKDVPGLSSGVIALDGYCALTNTGAAKCWKTESRGDGFTTARVVPGLAAGVRALGASSRGAGCALMTNGVVKWWLRSGKAVEIHTRSR